MTAKAVICECFARDGLQHEPGFVASADKIAVIDAFTRAGFSRIEATSYSHPERVPAFADGGAVLSGITRGEGVYYKATCPNLRAVERALADADAGHGAEELSLLVSATESHTRRNLNTDKAGQWTRIEEMAAAAGGRFRLVGVISVALGCPFEGAVDPAVVAEGVARFAALGVTHIALADTTGLGTPSSVKALWRRAWDAAPTATLIAHFHNTRGTGLMNCAAALEAGCTHFDSAMGGVGGHPAKIHYGGGRTGNVATEDLANFLEAEGVGTGLDLDALIEASRLCENVLGRPLDSQVARAGYGLIPGRSFMEASS